MMDNDGLKSEDLVQNTQIGTLLSSPLLFSNHREGFIYLILERVRDLSDLQEKEKSLGPGRFKLIISGWAELQSSGGIAPAADTCHFLSVLSILSFIISSCLSSCPSA
ncbi:hypothetical protein SUGI_0990340 [Cryptomeria japonica]|nr:hypothetical protein SUGI_0990340 [Cryptomeria japonica]